MVIRRRLSVVALAAFFFLALCPIDTGAQSLTGALVGTVKDSQGGVLPAAVVRVTSEALMRGEERTTSNDKGQWRFPVLPPGQYLVTVELPPKFAAYRNAGLSVGAGETIELAVVLQLAGVAETVTVDAASINSRSSGLETRFGPDYIRTVPSRRFSMFDLIRSAPGVSPTSPGSGTVNSVSVFGSAVNENTFLIDGTNFTCPCQGVSRSEPIVDVIQEAPRPVHGRIGRVRQSAGGSVQRHHQAGRRSRGCRDVLLRAVIRPHRAARCRRGHAGHPTLERLRARQIP